MENWIRAYLEVMQSCNGMDDESESQLGRRVEEFLKVLEAATGKQVRGVEVAKNGCVNAIINDGRYLHENPMLFEDPKSVAGFNDSNKLQESQKELGKLNKRLHYTQKQAGKAEKENITLREADKAAKRNVTRKINVLQNDIKNLRSAVSKKEEKL